MKSHKICYQSRLASIITVYTDLTSKLKLKWLPGARSTGAQLIRLLPIRHVKYVICESAAKLLWPVTLSMKRALSAEVRRRFYAPKFQMPNISAIGAWSEIYPMPFWIDLSETRRFN